MKDKLEVNMIGNEHEYLPIFIEIRMIEIRKFGILVRKNNYGLFSIAPSNSEIFDEIWCEFQYWSLLPWSDFFLRNLSWLWISFGMGRECWHLASEWIGPERILILSKVSWCVHIQQKIHTSTNGRSTWDDLLLGSPLSLSLAGGYVPYGTRLQMSMHEHFRSRGGTFPWWRGSWNS